MEMYIFIKEQPEVFTVLHSKKQQYVCRRALDHRDKLNLYVRDKTKIQWLVFT